MLHLLVQLLVSVKKLTSLEHCVRSQITRLKLQKLFCDLELRARCIIMNIVLIIVTIKYS